MGLIENRWANKGIAPMGRSYKSVIGLAIAPMGAPAKASVRCAGG
jgi:hypothetical protein